MKTMIEMAHEVYGEHTFWTEDQLLRLKELERLVRADERERLAKIQFESILQAIKIEREACAKVCDEVERKSTKQPPMVGQGCQACAVAIRARGF